MEGSDAFANETDDPFAGSDFGEFGDEEKDDGKDAPIPTVNADGDVIDPPPAVEIVDTPATGVKETDEEADTRERIEVAEAAAENQAEKPDPTPASSPASDVGVEANQPTSQAPVPSESTASSEAASSTPAAENLAPVGGPAEDPEQAAKLKEWQERKAAEEAAKRENAAAVEEASKVDPDVAPIPDEKKDKKDRVTHRRYVILQVTSPQEFKLVQWYEDKEGRMVERGGPKARRQKYALARDNEGALAVGFAALGSPEKGIPLVAVAESLFQIKTVAPDEPEPAKRKLKIS